MNGVSQAWYQLNTAHGGARIRAGRQAIIDALQRLDQPFAVVETADGLAVATDGQALIGGTAPGRDALRLRAFVPALPPDHLGDPTFQEDYGVGANYVCGAMANGIGSAEIVIEMAKAGMMGFFGSAGLPTSRITAAIDQIQAAAPGLPAGFNLIHSPHEPWQEQETVDLYLARGVNVISAAAFLRLTPQVVQYRATGLRRRPDGTIAIPNKILAKVSREEVAIQFLKPPPQAILDRLVSEGRITAEEASLASQIPMADDLTAEADSGGHTDNQAAPVLIPLLCSLRDRVCRDRGYHVRVGAAGGIATPASAAAAFTLGAAYVVTGTVNQACVESGTSEMVKRMLATATANDVGMAPASDMFEAGVEVQVLKRGTLFAMRGHKLLELYRRHDGLHSIPAEERARIEKQLFRTSLDEIWASCEAYFGERDPAQLTRAAEDPKHKMALVFRWYLGMSSRWAIAGDDSRTLDTQIWCGPAIGAFNDWTRSTFLADPAERRVAVVAANMMAGAAAVTRARQLLTQGIDPGPEAYTWTPRPLA